MGRKNNLAAAQKSKKDEFYTMWSDIKREINAYLDFDPNVFKNKVILLPCDDPFESDFFKYFATKFKDLGIKIVEFEKNRSKTECCGCGGMVGVTNKELWLSQKNKRANSTEYENIVSYCESCVNTFKSSDKNALHILDFIFNQDVINGKAKSQKNISTINQWINRIKLANKVGKES